MELLGITNTPTEHGGLTCFKWSMMRRFSLTNCSLSTGANRTFLLCLCRNMSGMQPLQISPRLSFLLGVCILGRKSCWAVPGPECLQNKLPIKNHGATWPAMDVFPFWFGCLSLWTPVVFLPRLAKSETGDLDRVGCKYLFSKILSGKWKWDCMLFPELSTRGIHFNTLISALDHFRVWIMNLKRGRFIHIMRLFSQTNQNNIIYLKKYSLENLSKQNNHVGNCVCCVNENE